MRDVSTKVVRDQLEFLRNHGLPEVALRAAHPRMWLYEAAGADAYIAWDSWTAFTRDFHAELVARGLVEPFVLTLMREPRSWLGRLRAVLTPLGDAKLLYRGMAAAIGSRSFPCAKAKLAEHGEARLELTVELRPGLADNAAFCEYLRVGFALLPTFVGLPRSVVSVAKTEGRIAYTILPPPSASPWRRLKRALALTGRAEYLRLLESEAELARLRHDLERRVQERTRELVAAKEKAEAGNRAKNALLANVSHELRTPLSAMMGFTELMQRDPKTNPDHQRNLDVIRRNGKHLLGIIDDLLDLARLETGRAAVTVAPTELLDEAGSVVAALRPAAASKGVDVALVFAPSAPATVVTDGQRLRQVLMNVIGNAVKFTAAGRIDVEVAASEGPEGRAQVRFTVADTGEGISEEKHAAVFEAFEQADTSTRRRFGGTGLGLALARQYARLLGGDVVLASSAPGRGSVFVVTVDQAPAGPAPLEPQRPENSRHCLTT